MLGGRCNWRDVRDQINAIEAVLAGITGRCDSRVRLNTGDLRPPARCRDENDAIGRSVASVGRKSNVLCDVEIGETCGMRSTSLEAVLPGSRAGVIRECGSARGTDVRPLAVDLE